MDCEVGMANECINLEDGGIKSFDRLEKGVSLTKEYFCDVFGLLGNRINF
jgi:hypothetical protein